MQAKLQLVKFRSNNVTNMDFFFKPRELRNRKKLHIKYQTRNDEQQKLIKNSLELEVVLKY